MLLRSQFLENFALADFEELDSVWVVAKTSLAAVETVCESETVDVQKPLANGQTVVVAHATLRTITIHPLRGIKGHGSQGRKRNTLPRTSRDRFEQKWP